MLVIAADTDPLFLQFVERSLTGTEFEPRAVEQGYAAWELVQGAPPPVVVLYSWGLAANDGSEPPTRHLRAPRDCYFIATLGPEEGPALVSAVESGADDVLVKPFSADALLSRLRLAALRCASPERLVGTPFEAVREALANPFGGEVVVRRGDRVGRIHVSSGKIAWANMSGAPVRLRSVMQSAGVELDDETAAALLEEARRLRVHFAEMLVRWGLVDEAGARECVRALVAEQLDELLSMQDATALFLPRTGEYPSGLSFALSEVAAPTIAPASRRSRSLRTRRRADKTGLEERYGAYAERARKLEGATGAAAFDRATGASLACDGEAIDRDLAWSLLGTLAALGPGAQDAIAVRDDAAFLVRTIDETAALVVGFELMRTNIGLARSSLNRLVALRGIASHA